jgi:hypothetical protein
VESLPDGLTYKTGGAVDAALAVGTIGMTNPTDKTSSTKAVGNIGRALINATFLGTLIFLALRCPWHIPNRKIGLQQEVVDLVFLDVRDISYSSCSHILV